jgi:hypothetical protein
MRFNGPVHSIRSEIKVSRPGDRACLKPSLTEAVFVTQRSKHAGISRVQEISELDSPLGAIIKAHAQTEARQDF